MYIHDIYIYIYIYIGFPSGIMDSLRIMDLIKQENKSNTSKKSNIPLFFNLFYFL